MRTKSKIDKIYTLNPQNMQYYGSFHFLFFKFSWKTCEINEAFSLLGVYSKTPTALQNYVWIQSGMNFKGVFFSEQEVFHRDIHRFTRVFEDKSCSGNYTKTVPVRWKPYIS